LIDSHAHLHDKAFDADREAVVRRMHGSSVETAVSVGCDLEDSRRAAEVAARYGLYASAGIHPHEAKNAPADIAVAFEPLLETREVVAIGETGLDFYYDFSPRDVQERLLRSQLRLALERSLPLIFHVRDAHERMIEILREEAPSALRGVVHCFTGDAAQARAYVEGFGLFLGIGGVATFKNAQPLRDAIARVGVEPLLLETDCPYLSPNPMRGRRNEPAFMTHTLETVAQILRLERSAVDRVTTNNARALFKL
jgi:TatD DNase family protein